MGREGDFSTAPMGPERPARDAVGRIHAATLFCELCARSTEHRILRLDPRPRESRSVALSGIARCRECGTTHRFANTASRLVSLREVVSERDRSTYRTVELPGNTTLTVGQTRPLSSPPVIVRRIDLATGLQADTSRAVEATTVWVVPEGEPRVRLSLIEGARTRSEFLPMGPEEQVVLGQVLQAHGSEWVVTALRTKGRTWRQGTAVFPVSELERVYARRAEIPPAGRRPWSRSRGKPNSRESSTSRTARSRSSPGVRRKRTTP